MKGKFAKKFLSLLIVMTMVFSMGLMASAAEVATPESPTEDDGNLNPPQFEEPDAEDYLESGNALVAANGVVTLLPVAGELTDDDFFAAIDAAVEEGVDVIYAVMSTGSMSVISADVFAEMKENGIGLNILAVTDFNLENITTMDEYAAYAWMIPEITDAVALNPALEVNPEDSEAAKLINGTSVVVDFEQSGKLPGLSQIGVAASADEVKGINDPVLYYYNESAKTLEKQDNEVAIGEGEVDFMINHCSTYVVADKSAAVKNGQTTVKAAQTGDSAPIALYVVAAVIALGAAAVVVIRKRKAA